MAIPLNLKRTLQILWNSGPKWMVANVLLLAIQGVIPVIALYLMKLIIDSVTAGIKSSNTAATFERVQLLIGLAVLVAVLGILVQAVAKIVKDAQAQLMSDYIYDKLHAKSIEVDLEYYDNSNYYDTLHQAQTQAVYRPFNIMMELLGTAQNAISLTAIIGLLISLHWVIALILFVTALPGILVRLKFANRQYRWMQKRTSTERQANYMSQLLTQDAHAKEVRLFALGNYFQDKFRFLRRKLHHEKLALITKRTIQEAGVQLGATLAVFGAFAFIAYQTIRGSITIGELVMYHQAFQKGQEFLERMMSNLAMLYEDNLFLSNLYKFLDLKPQVVEPLYPVPVPRPMKSGLVFNNVSFNYPNSSRKALQNINLTIKPGEVVALVGENGSGKTTLVKLLCRLYDPHQGSISIDGIDLREFSITALRREFSVIFQDYAKYHLTAKENIWFGDIGLETEDDKIIKAALRSGAHDVIERLPQSYGTTLGKLFEEGEELSIGQWQKVALARAFLRDSQVIVLDEPTSAMDPKAEYEVFKTFRELLRNQAAILISHRLSTVKMADRIYVLERGQLLEQGTHQELMNLGGIYAQLFERQAQQYLI